MGAICYLNNADVKINRVGLELAKTLASHVVLSV